MEGAEGEGGRCTAQDQYRSGMVWTRTRHAFLYGDYGPWPGTIQYYTYNTEVSWMYEGIGSSLLGGI